MGIILFTGKIVLVIISIIFTYILLGLIIPIIPTNTGFSPHKGGIKIFIVSNGVHADFLIPAVNSVKNWGTYLDFNDYKTQLNPPVYLGVGWGDRGFYLDTPTWAELKFSTAVNAMCRPTPTVMHITAYDAFPAGFKFTTEIEISAEQYLELCNFIIKKFRVDSEGAIEILPGVGYTPQDNFYEAEGSYHAFNTCNVWISKGLREIGVRTALWSPSDRGIFYQLKKIQA